MTAVSVLVTDGETRASLAVARSLVQAGYRVHVAARERSSLAGTARGISASCVMPDNLSQPGPFREAVIAYVAAHRIGVVLPITDAAVLALLPARSALRPAVMPLPSESAFRAVSDKSRLRAAAEAVGLAYPAEWRIDAPGDATRVGVVQYPVVIKPARSVVDVGGARRKTGVRFADTAAELAAVIADYDPAAYPLLVQQRIVGPGVGVFLLMHQGRAVATFAHRRLREKPPAGGVSVYAESVEADPDLRRRSLDLLARFEWEGVAMIEYKIDQATNTPYLMEINGRFWGSLQLAVDAGVDFPRLLVECALGAHPITDGSYRIGAKSRWWWGNVDHLLTRLTHSSADLHLPPGAPSQWRAILDFASSAGPRTRDGVFRFRDPGPFVLESWQWLRRLV